nr:MAG TPA: hypothetical protein [Caudoviricetes sp.]
MRSFAPYLPLKKSLNKKRDRLISISYVNFESYKLILIITLMTNLF